MNLRSKIHMARMKREVNMSRSKRWLALFLALVAVGIGLFMAVNFTVDPTGYFTVERGADSVGANGYTRAAKCKYIKKNADQYNAVVLGGSKAGVLSTELLSQYSGKSYYNFYVAYGCFSDFLTYARYLVNTVGVEEITLHLSSIEVQKYSRADENEIYEVPAVVNGSLPELILENLNYLCRDITASIDYIRTGNEELERGMDSIVTGERNYSYPYSLMEEDREAYNDKYVLVRYEKRLKAMFDKTEPTLAAAEDNIAAMKKIKKLCDNNGVKLNVVIGPTFMSEIPLFECEAYYDYLRELVQITDMWDFSGFIPENRNPYNFVNEGHYDNAVADLMVNTMYGKEQKEGFGTLLTKDNIEEYLAARQAEYDRLKKEYKENGTLELYDMDHESYIG